MDKRIGDEAPNLRARPNLGAVKHQIIHQAAVTCGEDKRGQDRAGDVQANEHRRHIHGIASHPRDWAIIIGGSDSEHEPLIALALVDASKVVEHRLPVCARWSCTPLQKSKTADNMSAGHTSRRLMFLRPRKFSLGDGAEAVENLLVASASCRWNSRAGSPCHFARSTITA